MAQYLDKAGLTTLWTKIKNTFALKKHTHKKSEITDLTIPTVNNPTITINQGGVKKGSFSLNQSGAATIDLTDDNTTYSAATQSADGLMSAADKKKLEGIAEGANKITVDSALSSTSTNPVQNKVIKSALDGKAGLTHEHSISNITGLQTALNGKQEKGDYYTINGVQARDDEFVIGDGNGGLVASGYTTSSFASSNHDHDSRYYTESEIDDKLGKKANISHSHSSLTNSSGRIFNVPTGGSGGEQKTLVITDDLNAYQPAGNYASASHDHTISDITGLYDELTGMTYVADSSDNSVQLETYGDGNSFSIPTKGYVDSALNGKSNLDHNHDSVYQAKGDYATNDTLKSYVTGTTFIDYTTYIEGEVNKKANISHDHTISNITGLQSALDGKSGTGHTHTISNITNLQSTIDGIYTDMGLQDEAIAGKADAVHEHKISSINGLQSALDGKSNTGHGHTISDITNLQSTLNGKLNDYGSDTSRPGGTIFTFPGGSNPVQMRSGNKNAGRDIGIFSLTDDNAFICNSSDNGYAFAVFDTDKTADFSTASNAAFAVLSEHAGVSIKGGLTVDGNITAGDVSASSTSNRLTFRHLDGQNCNGDYNLYLQYHQQNSRIYLNGSTYYIENGYYYNGIAAQSNLINPRQNVTSTGESTWDPTGSGKIIWGQKFVNSAISNDTGDLTLFLRPSVYGSGATELCMNIDGDYYSMGTKLSRDGHTHSKSEVGLGNVDNTADANKNVNYANSAGSANSVAWGNVSGRPSSLPASNISMSSDGTTLTITYS